MHANRTMNRMAHLSLQRLLHVRVERGRLSAQRLQVRHAVLHLRQHTRLLALRAEQQRRLSK